MDSNNKKHEPFWQPWGVWGCLWRSLLFLLGIALICLLLAVLLRGCNKIDSPINPFAKDSPINPFAKDSIDNPYKGKGRTLPEDPYKDLPEDLRNDTPVESWRDSIPGVCELPSPRDNYIPPVDSTRIITNPIDSISKIVCDQLVVFFNSTDIKSDMASFARQFKQIYPAAGYKIIYYNPAAGTMLLAVPQDRLVQVAKELPEKITDIDFRVSTNEILEESGKPSDPGFDNVGYDEYFKLIQAYEAWDITKGSSDVKVAIVDSYFDLSNPEIGERYVDPIHIPSKTKNILPPARMPASEDELTSFCHGSHVAGIAIGGQDNALGCSGIAPKCTWIPISLGNQLTSLNIFEGLLYAVYNGADVVNFSIGRSFPKEAKNVPIGDQIDIAKTTDKMGENLWEYIIKVANDHNCVLCTSAGNNTILMGLDPKNRSNSMIKVEAVDGKGQMASFSNFGVLPDADLHYSTVAAPGVKLWSVTPKHCVPVWQKLGYVAKEGFQEMDGTSMASPVVAGAVALLKSKNKNLTTDQVIKILTMTAKQTDTKNPIGPTIQIKDALDATGGELANFDDLMKDHNLLIGKWRSTHEVNLVSAATNEKKDEIWVYFIFNSTSSGVLEYHTIMNSRKIYRANLNVKWGTSSITITQQGPAISSDGDTVNKDDFVCKPDKDRLLEASCQRNGVERYKFRLEKVN